MEPSSEELSPSHETPTMNDALSDVIDGIGRRNLDSVPTQSTEQPGPSEKGPPKWLTKTLDSVHPDEVGKTGTRNSNRQNGGDVDDSDSPVDMDVSYDCELNLSTDFEPTSFKEVVSHDEWKEAMQKEYDALIMNGRLVEKCFAQKEGVDYEDTFSPTAKWATIQTIFSLAAQNGWKSPSNGCKNCFLEWRSKRECFYVPS